MALKLSPKPIPNQPGFKVTFRHPLLNNSVRSFGLGTQNQDEADAICRDAELIFKDPALLKDPTSPRLLAYKVRAVHIVHGEAAAARVQSNNLPTLDADDIGTLTARIGALLNVGVDQMSLIEAALTKFENKRYAELRERITELENQVKKYKPLADELQDENSRIRREHNLHVKITVEKAFSDWKSGNDYGALSAKTQNETLYAVDKFIASLPEQGRMQLGDIRARHISEWLNKLRGKKEQSLSAVTKSKMKRYLSVFIAAVFRDHDLAENPMDKTGSVKGAALSRESIDAISDFKQLVAMLDAVKDISAYWHTLLATAVLAGPRYAELVWLKIEHVNIGGNYIRIATRKHGGKITGTKTGRERSVPIETSILRPLLIAHVKRRQAEQRRTGASEAEQSPWLFPSTVPTNEFKPRTLTPAGLWSDNGVFLDAWKVVKEKAAKSTGPRDYWSYGPREWRHCAGTAMGYAGNDTGRVSSWLGNSEDVCKRHYKKPSEQGATWPLSF